MIDELDHWHCESPVCPYCGRKEFDVWALTFNEITGEAIIQCEECANTYKCFVEREAYYTTRKLKENK